MPRQRPRGPMDKALAYGAGDCQLESYRSHTLQARPSSQVSMDIFMLRLRPIRRLRLAIGRRSQSEALSCIWPCSGQTAPKALACRGLLFHPPLVKFLSDRLLVYHVFSTPAANNEFLVSLSAETVQVCENTEHRQHIHTHTHTHYTTQVVLATKAVAILLIIHSATGTRYRAARVS